MKEKNQVNIEEAVHQDFDKILPDLQKENKTLQLVLNSLSDGVIVADINGEFIFFNLAAEQILGMGQKNINMEEWSSVYGCFYPDKVTPYPPDKLPLAHAIRSEEISSDLIFIRNPKKPDGTFIEVSGKPLRDNNGVASGGIVILRDVSNVKQAEIEKKQSEERIKAQFKGFPIPTYVWQHTNNDFKLVDYNDAAEKITYGKVKNFIGQTVNNLYADAAEVREDFHKCYTQKTMVSHEMMSYFLKTTSEEKEMIFSYVFVPPDLVLLHTEDITEQKKNLATLKKLSKAVEQTADSVILTNRDGVIEYVNSAFNQTTGYSREEAIGKTPKILQSGKHSKSFYDSLWKTLRKGESYRGTIINKKKNGDIYWSEQSITPLKDEFGKITNFVSVLKDITDLKKKQEQEFQLNIAREVQQGLNKNTKISLPGYDIWGANYPAVETSGDYFDFIWFKDGSVGFVIGDVCGHGIGAALIMAETRAYLRSFAKTESDPGEILTLLNDELVSDLDDGRFVTLQITRLFPTEKRLDYASAGHVPGYHLDNNGEIKNLLECTGIPLGIIKNYQYPKSDSFDLEHDDIVAFITDGIYEAHASGDRQFGLDRTLETIMVNKKKSAKKIVSKLYEAVQTFSKNKPQEDDITSIICKVNHAG